MKYQEIRDKINAEYQELCQKNLNNHGNYEDSEYRLEISIETELEALSWQKLVALLPDKPELAHKYMDEDGRVIDDLHSCIVKALTLLISQELIQLRNQKYGEAYRCTQCYLEAPPTHTYVAKGTEVKQALKLKTDTYCKGCKNPDAIQLTTIQNAGKQ